MLLFHRLLPKLPGTKKIELVLKILFAYIALCGLIMFPCFIFEESIQMATFGSWPAKTARDWSLVLEGCDIIKNLNRGLKIINYSVGWIQPLAFLSYRAFGKATDFYVEALEKEAFAHSPQSFVGKKIRFTFIPEKVIKEGGEIKLIHKRIQVIVAEMPSGKKVEIRGVVEMRGKVVVIRDEGRKNEKSKN